MLNGFSPLGNAGAELPERLSVSNVILVEEVRFKRSGLVLNPVKKALNLIHNPMRSGIRHIARVH
jgi:hypothetical protein